jgi:hypothetical protein
MQKKRNDVFVASASSKYFVDKKGQITLFIIMGIFLLLAVAIIIGVQKEIVTFPKEEILPTGKGKFERIISACILDLGEEAIFRIGLQSGHLEVPEDILIDPQLSIPISPFQAIPYWAYGERLSIVPLQTIKEDIDEYIEENLRECVLGREPFIETYEVVELSPIVSDTEIVQAKTLFNVRWNLAIKTKTGETVSEIINHVAESQIKLKQTHEMAKKIVNQEMLDLKLEDITQDLIALEHSNVPLAGFEMTCEQKTWDYQELQASLKDLLRVNIAQLQIKGNQFIEYPKELPYYNSHYVWNIGTEPNPDITVSFDYQDNYPTSIQVRPRNGNKMQSASTELGDILSFFCMQNWKFVYDVIFPVVINVHDETTNFVFQTAVTVHLGGNVPDRSGTNSPPKSTPISSFNDQEYCKTSRVPMSVYSYELVENGEGVYNRDPLDAVDLTFTCLKYSCPMGQTEYDLAGMGDISAQQTIFPYCVGGIIKGNKEGYKEGWQRAVTTDNAEFEVNLIPLFKVPSSKISFVKHDYLGEDQFGPAIPITDETVLLTITFDKADKPNTLPGEPFHRSRLAYSPESDLNTEQQLELLGQADFTYHLDIKLMQDNNIIGGYDVNWTVDWQNIQNAQQLIFHVMESPTAGNNLLDFVLELPQKSTLLTEPELR